MNNIGVYNNEAVETLAHLFSDSMEKFQHHYEETK